jgi:hypothetical protein
MTGLPNVRMRVLGLAGKKDRAGRSPQPAEAVDFASLSRRSRCLLLAKRRRTRRSHILAIPAPLYAGAGGACSRAMNDRISWNSYHYTAISAVWNVM